MRYLALIATLALLAGCNTLGGVVTGTEKLIQDVEAGWKADLDLVGRLVEGTPE